MVDVGCTFNHGRFSRLQLLLFNMGKQERVKDWKLYVWICVCIQYMSLYSPHNFKTVDMVLAEAVMMDMSPYMHLFDKKGNKLEH